MSTHVKHIDYSGGWFGGNSARAGRYVNGTDLLAMLAEARPDIVANGASGVNVLDAMSDCIQEALRR